MRQSFEIRGGPEHGRQNLPRLRAVLAQENLDGFYVPHEDEYQNEYLPDAHERLAWVTGFTGSAGAAMVLSDRAAVFADGRYTLQVREQVDADLFEIESLPAPGPFGWLAGQDLAGKTVAYDPMLLSPSALNHLKTAADKAGATLKALDTNPIDQAWTDQPDRPMEAVYPQPLEVAGLAHDEKRRTVGQTFAEDGADAAVLTAPASIAWAFNIRGGDVACSPLPLSRAILHADGQADLFLAPEKVSDELRDHLGNAVRVRPPEEIESALAALSGKTISLDPDAAPVWFFDQLTTVGASILRQRDPVMLPKARKNAAELAGTQAAHLRDGVALIRFLHWLDSEAQSGEYTEIDAATVLEGFRDDLGGLKDLSFETISGAGPNGALPHYRVSTASNLKLSRGTLYLVDSGGQYVDGTTDVTRTVPIGTPREHMKRHYTLVLKGHIALATVRFPDGTTGTHLDTLARHALWQAGLDYDHGTGHGVGVYLGVHEGPQRIAKAWNSVALQPGMIVSNEPGYYREGEYGIRIENLQYVTEASPIDGGERDMFGFANLTWAPLARDLIDVSLLSNAEHDWVNQYHADVSSKLAASLDGDVAAWLKGACAPI